jgi:thiamine pyrophosphate-dependent acetolactate synthase large subunit-like protein
MHTTVADQFVDGLISAGAKRVYGVVGDSLNGLTDAVRRIGKIECIHVRHEEVSAFAAGSEAHMAGSLTVCAGAAAPATCTSSTSSSIATACRCRCWRSPRISLRAKSVFNNGALGFIELERKSTGFINTCTQLNKPNFAAAAEAVGIRGIRLEKPDDVKRGIAAALAHDGPVLVDAVVNRQELAMPPAVTVEMAKGFSFYMVKAILSGQADEVFDLARSNLWR